MKFDKAMQSHDTVDNNAKIKTGSWTPLRQPLIFQNRK